MVEGTYDIIAEGTNLLNRSIVKKLNTLFNNNETYNEEDSEGSEIKWDESIVQKVYGYNYQQLRITPVYIDNVYKLFEIEHYEHDGKQYINIRLLDDICATNLPEVSLILKQYTNSYTTKFVDNWKVIEKNSDQNLNTLRNGMKFKFKSVRKEYVKGLKCKDRTTKIYVDDVFTITKIEHVDASEISNSSDIKKEYIQAVIEIRDSVGNVYSSKHNANFWAFFTCQSVEELVVLK